ncbi:CoA pyrophosphatase [Pacificibacter marinus]|uniref:CoA pyrophosphatase n=1 Tax=Pacificibacter marinus TaxID=658057 RepID=UPI001C0654F3|nr:CoA pyrophosphatase [Pacificibacter marinus]MBU2866706.1 CoA pyrophosphatase [Pacificibacter marinus]
MVTRIDRLKIERALSLDGRPSSDFDLNPKARPKAVVLKPAGVLLPIVERDYGLQLILTKRSSTIKHHPGQIAFPGGRVDPTDATHIAAALREADEEIGLPPENVDVLGELPSHETISNYTMHPVVGWVTQNFTPRLEAAEVSEMFEVPLLHVLDISNYTIQSRIWRRQVRKFYTVPYGPYYIWGATARVLRSFAQKVSL